VDHFRSGPGSGRFRYIFAPHTINTDVVKLVFCDRKTSTKTCFCSGASIFESDGPGHEKIQRESKRAFTFAGIEDGEIAGHIAFVTAERPRWDGVSATPSDRQALSKIQNGRAKETENDLMKSGAIPSTKHRGRR